MLKVPIEIRLKKLSLVCGILIEYNDAKPIIGNAYDSTRTYVLYKYNNH